MSNDTIYFEKGEVVTVRITGGLFNGDKFKQARVVGISVNNTEVLVEIIDTDEPMAIHQFDVFKEQPMSPNLYKGKK